MAVQPPELSAAAALLPAWVRWGDVPATVVAALLAAGGGGWVASRIALARVRRLDGAPWPERARVSFAARQAMVMSASALAFACSGLAWIFAGPFSAVSPWGLAALAWTVGLAVGLGWYRAVGQRLREAPVSLRQAMRGGASSALMLLSPLAPVLLALPLMPAQLGRDALPALALATLGVLALVCGGAVWIGRCAGLVRPAGARLGGVVDGVARRLGVGVRGVYEIDWGSANAFALPVCGWMLFTTRAVALLTDEQLAAVAAHELGHLAESRRMTVTRVLRALLPVPLVLLVPLVAADGWVGLLYVCGPILVVARAFAWYSRRLEARADAFGHAGAAAGVYASALEAIHRANLAPVVLGRGATHPDLYDRMLAAGVAPAYTRPGPPSRLVGPLALAAALLVGGALALATPLALVRLVGGANDAARLHAALLVDRSNHAGTIARLADLRATNGDTVTAATLYRAAAQLAGARWSAAAYRASALAVANRCHDARRLLAVARSVFARSVGGGRPALSLVAAWTAVRRCAVRGRSAAIAAGALAL